ncbi:hypothetical protein PMAYCL1PPCAC_08543, partial [Pristionchus mayeri]
SKSTRLLISLHNEDCDFLISDDHATLLFDSMGKGVISYIDLQLSTTEQKLIQSYSVPCHAGRISSVRVDAIYPTVFEDSEEI